MFILCASSVTLSSTKLYKSRRLVCIIQHSTSICSMNECLTRGGKCEWYSDSEGRKKRKFHSSFHLKRIAQEVTGPVPASLAEYVEPTSRAGRGELFSTGDFIVAGYKYASHAKCMCTPLNTISKIWLVLIFRRRTGIELA